MGYLDAYPKGWQNPINARASAALPAAGAWDATPTEFFCTGANFASLNFTYTRGAAGGSFDYQVQVSPYSVAALVPAGGEEWMKVAAFSVGAVAGGVDTQSLTQAEYVTYESTGAGAEAFTIGPVEIEGVYERMRIVARESGVVGSPGTLQIAVELIA